MLMAEFPFDSQQMDGHSAEDEDQMTYNVWAKQVLGGGADAIPIRPALQLRCVLHAPFLTRQRRSALQPTTGSLFSFFAPLPSTAQGLLAHLEGQRTRGVVLQS